mmetsp:Transcript_38976/g.102976  ORF Transcript_38976/g.102976 Transcript_38976/m.102976 type:complete len:122 (-) Transcript_38976:137-502(-)
MPNIMIWLHELKTGEHGGTPAGALEFCIEHGTPGFRFRTSVRDLEHPIRRGIVGKPQLNSSLSLRIPWFDPHLGRACRRFSIAKMQFACLQLLMLNKKHAFENIKMPNSIPNEVRLPQVAT